MLYPNIEDLLLSMYTMQTIYDTRMIYLHTNKPLQFQWNNNIISNKIIKSLI